MPTYSFIDKETGETFDKLMKYVEVEQFLLDNPNLERNYQGEHQSIGDSVRLGIRKIDNGFREVLHKIAEKTPGGKGLKDNIR